MRQFCRIGFLILGLTASLFAFAKPISVRDFVSQFMELQLEKNRAKASQAEVFSFISQQFIRENKINVNTVYLNSYRPDRYEILASTENRVDVKIYNDVCIRHGGCPGDHILRIALVHEGDHLAILPYGYAKGSKYLDFWWQDIQGKYELPESHICPTAPAQQKN
jgi:hypothetical protein